MKSIVRMTIREIELPLGRNVIRRMKTVSKSKILASAKPLYLSSMRIKENQGEINYFTNEL